MRRRTKAEKADAFAPNDAGYAQGTKADNTGAEQRCCMQIIQSAGKPKYKIAIHVCVVSVPTVDIIAGKSRRVTEVLLTASAVFAAAVESSDP